MRIESQQPEPSAADRRPRRPRARRWVLRCVLIGLALATMTRLLRVHAWMPQCATISALYM